MKTATPRRIDQLKAIAYDCNLTNEQAKQFGKLSATATWEKLLKSHGLEFETKSEIAPNTVATASNEAPHQVDLMQWVDFSQLLAVTFASLGVVVLVLNLYLTINPLNLLPVKITIQVGK